MSNTNNTTRIIDNPEITRNITRVLNVDEVEIMITETKLENILLKYGKRVFAKSDWKTPLGLCVTVSLVFLTANFNKSFLGIESSAWELFFSILLVVACLWLFVSLCYLLINKNKNIDFLIRKIKNSDE